MRKQRCLAGLLAAGMLLGGCGAAVKNAAESDTAGGAAAGGAVHGAADRGEAGASVEMSVKSEGALKTEVAPGSTTDITYGSVSEADSMTDADMAVDSFAPEEPKAAYDMAEDGAVSDEAAPEEMPVETPTEIITPSAGLLTAGEWCDNENWGFLTNLVQTGNFDFNAFGIVPYERVVVHAVANGEAAKQVKTELFSAEGVRLAGAVTDYSGTAYLYYNTFGENAAADYVVLYAKDGTETVQSLTDAQTSLVEISAQNQKNGEQQTPTDGEQQIQPDGQGIAGGQEIRVRSTEVTVELTGYTAPAKYLDLMFVFDTTGSMGDELLYLQKEFQDIAERVADQSTRFSVNFYRDYGDDYVVKANDFLNDISEVAQLLNSESADGGGDYEEAVDLALLNAVSEHAWNENAVKLMFMILDAPPHNTAEVAANLKQAVNSAAEQGIRIIPIASSGVDTATEALLRDLAMMTGGTYTFLTDHSGIGNSHLEPTIGAYEVENLNDMIVRLIQEYMQ